MSESTSVQMAFTAEGMPLPVKRSWWMRLMRRMLRRTDPPPVQPPGTVRLFVEFVDGGRRIQVFIPAARFEQAEID